MLCTLTQEQCQSLCIPLTARCSELHDTRQPRKRCWTTSLASWTHPLHATTPSTDPFSVRDTRSLWAVHKVILKNIRAGGDWIWLARLLDHKHRVIICAEKRPSAVQSSMVQCLTNYAWVCMTVTCEVRHTPPAIKYHTWLHLTGLSWVSFWRPKSVVPRITFNLDMMLIILMVGGACETSACASAVSCIVLQQSCHKQTAA